MRALCLKLFVDKGLASLHTVIESRRGDHTELTNAKQRSHNGMYAGSESLTRGNLRKHMQIDQENIFNYLTIQQSASAPYSDKLNKYRNAANHTEHKVPRNFCCFVTNFHCVLCDLQHSRFGLHFLYLVFCICHTFLFLAVCSLYFSFACVVKLVKKKLQYI